MLFIIIIVVSPFSTTALVAFRIYDMDCDGYISNGELYQVHFVIRGYCFLCLNFT